MAVGMTPLLASERTYETNATKVHTLTVDTKGKTTIPLFDLQELESASGIDRDVKIKAFGDAVRDNGFVAVKATEILNILIAQALHVQKEYFAQSLDVKMLDDHKNNGQTGFSPEGLESGAGSAAPDMKETFFITNNMEKWPEKLSNFKEVMGPYLTAMGAVTASASKMLFEYLGHPEIGEAVDNGDYRIRLAYYREQKEGDHPQAVWAKEHTDLNLVTALPRPSRQGLQLLQKDGTWLDVMVPEGYIILNLGDQMEIMTAGYFKATPHQVINADTNDKSARYAGICFGSLPFDFKLTKLANCVEMVTRGMTASEAGAYLAKMHSDEATVANNLFARLFEMGSMELPEDQIKKLISLGFCKNPCDKVREKYSHLFAKI